MSIRLGRPENQIRSLRVAQGLTAHELADKIVNEQEEKVSGSTILKIERGGVKLSDRYQRMIAQALDCDVGDLFTNATSGIPVLDEEELLVGQQFPERDETRQWIDRRDLGGGVLCAFKAREIDAQSVVGIQLGDVLIFRPGDMSGWPMKIVRRRPEGSGFSAWIKPKAEAGESVVGDIVDIDRPIRRGMKIDFVDGPLKGDERGKGADWTPEHPS